MTGAFGMWLQEDDNGVRERMTDARTLRSLIRRPLSVRCPFTVNCEEAPTGVEAKPTEGAERPQVNLMEVLQTSAPGLKPGLGMAP